jgi:hypothetical protein
MKNMLPFEPNKDHIWNRLQEPRQPVKAPAPYLLLLSALDTGWQILEPVRLEPSLEQNGQFVYHILLHRSPSPEIRILILPASHPVTQLLENESLQVDRKSVALSIGMPLYLS